jgi:hypothetical protein
MVWRAARVVKTAKRWTRTRADIRVAELACQPPANHLHYIIVCMLIS